MISFLRIFFSVGIFLCLCLLQACGGGDSSDTSSPPINDTETPTAPPGSSGGNLPSSGQDNSDGNVNSGNNGNTSSPFGLTQREVLNLPALSVNGNNATSFNLVNAFPSLNIQGPLVYLAPVPGENNIVAVDLLGIVRIFENREGVGSSNIFLDIRSQVNFDNGEQGLLGLAFAPDFENSGHVFLYYSSTHCPQHGGDQCSVISRFTRDGTGMLAEESEIIYLEVTQPGAVHNAGAIEFGIDDYLYIALGDGGDSSTSQNRTNLLGSILRLDVSGDRYRVPEDNPFVGLGLEEPGLPGAGTPIREEIWAYGFRNPYRMSFDRESGVLWVADVGQDAFEEINQVVRAGNYGWRVYEGADRRDSGDSFDNAISSSGRQFIEPVYQYGHDIGRSITGGVIYRGQALPSLQGAYLYGDFEVGKVWALTINENDQINNTEIASLGRAGISGFGLDHNGELYIVNYGGDIRKLEPNGDIDNRLPERLSQTGIFADLDQMIASTGLIPYNVNLPFWSDNTEKKRWIGIPDNTSIQVNSDNFWIFPVGTVAVKHFEINLGSELNPVFMKLETRVLLKQTQGWRGFTYRWNENETDAYLLNGREDTTLFIEGDSEKSQLFYRFPSPEDCSSCHNGSKGYLLGLNFSQLNRSFNYAGVVDNQIRSWNNIGLFLPSLEANASIPSSLVSTSELSVEQYSRDYLEVNCAFCHNINSTNRTNLVLSREVDLDEMNAVDQDPAISSLGIDGAKLIQVGSKEESILWQRMNTLNLEHRMPPDYSFKVDSDAVDAIGSWIDNMNTRQTVIE